MSDRYQDTIYDDETVIESARDDDLRLIREDVEDGEDVFRVRHENRTLEFTDGKRARVFFALSKAVGPWDETNVGRAGIPLEVAADGRPAITAYLFGRWGLEPEQITDAMDLANRKTVFDYLSKIRSRADLS